MADRVLVMQLARLGDLVQTWPLLTRLGHTRGGGEGLGLMADLHLKELQAGGPPVAAFWAVDPGSWAQVARSDFPRAYQRLRRLVEMMKSQDYDRIYNLNFSRLTLLMAQMLGGEVRGYRPARGGRDFLREPWLALVYGLVHARRVNRLHLSDVFRHLAPPAPGEPGPPRPHGKGGEPIIALQVGTRHPRRTWPLSAFTRLAGFLVERLGAWVWLLGTQAEAPLGKALLDGLPAPLRTRVVNLQGGTDLPALAARLRAAQLLVSGDTGTLHLAAALGVKTIGVFLGPASCFETGPYGAGHFVFQAEPPCHPCTEAAVCTDAFCQAMIPPEAVAELAAAVSTGESPTRLSRLPAQVRLYGSVMDPLGVAYAPQGSGWRFIDLVGQAYRRAGAHLAGVPWTAPPLPPGGVPPDSLPKLEPMLAALKNGGGFPAGDPEITMALTPLRAFQEELRRQGGAGQPAAAAQAAVDQVQAGFKAGLEEMASFIKSEAQVQLP